MAAFQERLGPIYDELRQTIMDVDSAPILLFSDEFPRLIEIRDKALAILHQVSIDEPDLVSSTYRRIPEALSGSTVSESLLTAVALQMRTAASIDVFDLPSGGSRAFNAVPSLHALLDESGLVDVTGLDARPWGLHIDRFALQYHQLLRRGFESNVHYQLIGTVLRLAEQHGLVARLALDDRRLRYKEEYRELEERDYWFGPRFAEDDLDDLAVVGETFHGDVDGGASWLHPYAGISVRWTRRDSQKFVEIEEFMPMPAPGVEWVFARYLHAIRDTEKRCFIHCDGAVKAFAADTYPTSPQGFRMRGKGDRYRKLFRIDGRFPTAAWSEIACSWFRGNRLILEYLEGQR